MVKKERETDIQAAICEYLTLKKVFFWRSNNVAIFSEGRFRAMPKFSRYGIPDIIAIMPPLGRFWGIEVKRPGGKLSDAQREFSVAIQGVGGFYTVATSVDDIVKAL